MEIISSISNLKTPNRFMAKIDIQGAYYSIPIVAEFQKHLNFVYNGNCYQLNCLPNSLCYRPRKFTVIDAS